MTSKKALTLWQPWASLYLALRPDGSPVKPFETRDWPAPAWLIGERLAIHAAKRPTLSCLSETGTPWEIILRMAQVLGYEGSPGAFEVGDFLEALPVGSMLGTVRIAGCYQVGGWDGPGYEAKICAAVPGSRDWAETARPQILSLPTDDFGDYRARRWLWEAQEIERFDRPIPVKGGQKIWNWKQEPRACAA